MLETIKNFFRSFLKPEVVVEKKEEKEIDFPEMIDVRREDIGRHSPWAFNENRFPKVPAEGTTVVYAWSWERGDDLVDCYPIAQGPKGSEKVWIYIPELKKNLFVWEREVHWLAIYKASLKH